MNALKGIWAILSLIIVMPIWFYLIHWLLVRAGADDLQMFLFWVYVPVGIICSLFQKIIELADE